jgi:hypothetical protein
MPLSAICFATIRYLDVCWSAVSWKRPAGESEGQAAAAMTKEMKAVVRAAHEKAAAAKDGR